MSHQPERKEKNCLNFGTMVTGYYCQNCGQPNIITKQSFWSLAKHFVYDILHFDGKFFHTLKHIFFRPGYVAKQYVNGKRASYLDPIRMYLFTSAIFFLVLFSLNKSNEEFTPRALNLQERQEWRSRLEASLLADPADKATLKKIELLNNTQQPVFESDMTDVFLFDFSDGSKYRSVEEYDSLQQTLPEGKRDGWIRKKISRRVISLNVRYRGMEKQGNRVIGNYILHQFPYMLFISLPFFALILKLVYIRKKSLYYSDHAIFTLFHYILSFLLLLFVFAFNVLENTTGWLVFNLAIVAIVLSWFIFFILELKNFYGQGWGKTILKFVLINFLDLFLLVVLLVIFFFLSMFQI